MTDLVVKAKPLEGKYDELEEKMQHLHVDLEVKEGKSDVPMVDQLQQLQQQLQQVKQQLQQQLQKHTKKKDKDPRAVLTEMLQMVKEAKTYAIREVKYDFPLGNISESGVEIVKQAYLTKKKEKAPNYNKIIGAIMRARKRATEIGKSRFKYRTTKKQHLDLAKDDKNLKKLQLKMAKARKKRFQTQHRTANEAGNEAQGFVDDEAEEADSDEPSDVEDELVDDAEDML